MIVNPDAQENSLSMNSSLTGESSKLVYRKPIADTEVFLDAVRLMRVPMCLSDPNQPDNPLVFVNRAFEDLTGYSAEEVLGQNCRFLQGPGTDQATVEKLKHAIASRMEVSIELFNYRKDGTGFWNALYISPVFSKSGELLYFFASQLDVTKWREAELVIQHGLRMDALGSVAAGVAHEFNNMMTIVRVSLEQARRHPSSDRQVEQLARAEWGAAQAARLTQQMLNFAHRQAPITGLTDLGELIRHMDSLLKQVAGNKIALTLAVYPEPLLVMTVAGKVELALFNLVQNAADAMQGGGVLTISTFRINKGVAGDFAVLEVADTGSGMVPEVVRQAIEPFFSTKGRGHGTGLGLSMVRDCAEQAGGSLEIESLVGHGTRIRIVLPLPNNSVTEAGILSNPDGKEHHLKP